LTGTKKEDLFFIPFVGAYLPSMKNWTEPDGPVDIDISEGSFFGGSPSAISWWSRTYYTYHDYYLGHWYFVGKDQTLINAILLMYPKRIITMWYLDPESPARLAAVARANPDVPPSSLATAPRHRFPATLFASGYLGACGPEWYYYQFWLSNRKTRDEARELWLDNDLWWPWRTWASWREPERCPMTELVGLEQLLRRDSVFGPEWKIPERRIGV